jgi:purine-binding chemotaxis protein CheW
VAVMDDRLLRERATRLAQQPQESASVEEIEVIIFHLGNEQYAIKVGCLRGVHPVAGLTRVPCTPPFVAGILNLRGEIITVLDLAALLGVRTDRGAESGDVLTVEANQQAVGVLVDNIVEIGKLAPGVMDDSTSAREFIAGISHARVALLDVDRLFPPRGFEIHEEVA